MVPWSLDLPVCCCYHRMKLGPLMFLPVVSVLYSQTLAFSHTAALLLLSWRQILLFCGRSHKTVAVNCSHASCVRRGTFHHPGHLIRLCVFLQDPEADARLGEGLNECTGSDDRRRLPEQRGYLRSSSEVWRLEDGEADLHHGQLPGQWPRQDRFRSH